MHVDLVGFEVVGEGLLDIENLAISERLVEKELVEDVVDVGGIGYGAVEVGGKPVDVKPVGDGTDGDESVVIPVDVVTAKLDLETVETVAGDPVLEVHGVPVIGFVSRQFGGTEGIETSH